MPSKRTKLKENLAKEKEIIKYRMPWSWETYNPRTLKTKKPAKILQVLVQQLKEQKENKKCTISVEAQDIGLTSVRAKEGL